VDADAAFREPLVDARQLQVNDLADFRLGEWLKDDDVVDAVDELGAKGLHENAADLALLSDGVVGVLGDFAAAQVRGHNDNAVFEINGAAFGVG